MPPCKQQVCKGGGSDRHEASGGKHGQRAPESVNEGAEGATRASHTHARTHAKISTRTNRVAIAGAEGVRVERLTVPSQVGNRHGRCYRCRLVLLLDSLLCVCKFVCLSVCFCACGEGDENENRDRERERRKTCWRTRERVLSTSPRSRSLRTWEDRLRELMAPTATCRPDVSSRWASACRALTIPGHCKSVCSTWIR